MKRLLALSIVTLLAIFFAVDSLHYNTQKVEIDKSIKLLSPTLGASLAQVTRIEVLREGDDTITLLKGEDNQWTSLERSNYPVKSERVDKLLNTLASSVIIEEKTDNPELYGYLGLDPQNALRVKIIAKDNNLPILDAYIGEFRYAQGGTYIREVKKQKSYLVSGEITPKNEINYWLKQDIFALDASRINYIKTQHISPNGFKQIIELRRDIPDVDLEVVKPNWSEKVDNYEASMIITAFTNVNLIDVQKNFKNIQEKYSPLQAVAETFDGLRITINFYTLADDVAHISSEFDPQIRKNYISRTSKSTNPMNFSLQSEETIKHQVSAINKRTQNWLYTLTPVTYSMFSRSPEAVLGANPNLENILTNVEQDPANNYDIDSVSIEKNILKNSIPSSIKNTKTNGTVAISPEAETLPSQLSTQLTPHKLTSDEEKQKLLMLKNELQNNSTIQKNVEYIDNLINNTKNGIQPPITPTSKPK